MIVTARARVLLVIAAVSTLMGVYTGRYVVAKFGLAFLIWLLWEWLLFRYRVDFALRRATVRRILDDRKLNEQEGALAASPHIAQHEALDISIAPRRTLWQGRTYQVCTEIQLPMSLGCSFAILTDRQPYASEVPGLPTAADHRPSSRNFFARMCDFARGTTRRNQVSLPAHVAPPSPTKLPPFSAHRTLGRATRVELRYPLVPTGTGVMQFEGVHLAMADLHGLFYAERFLPLRQRFRVFPITPVIGKPVNWKKTRNQLPPPGIHRFLHPGIGTDLLEIREYQPGDSPRSIAWKVTARRGELMTKQYESEVPVRCTLLVDVSRSVRVGYPQPTALDGAIRLVTAVVETVVANRDPIGMGLFDEQQVRMLRPSASRRTAMQIVDYLAEAAGQPLEPVELDLPCGELIEASLRLAREVYPTLYFAAVDSAGVISLQRIAARQRKELAAVLAAHYDLGLSGRADLSVNQFSLLEAAQRFLAEHQIPYPGPLQDEFGRDLFRAPKKIEQASKLLMSAVRRGRDNELFVIIADLLDLEEHLGPLLQAIKVATARHHRVVVMCTWPVNQALPARSGRRTSVSQALVSEPDTSTAQDLATVTPLSGFAATERIDQELRNSAFERLRSMLARFNVRVVCASERIAPQLILREIELLRGSEGLR